MRALITGVGGFVGRHLAAHLLESGDQVAGLGRGRQYKGLPAEVALYSADLRESQSVKHALRESRPEAVYHLAAQSSTGDSLIDPWSTISNNVHGQLVLLESLVELGLGPAVLIVGSSDEYGDLTANDLPTDERVPLRPSSPYAVSKVGQDMLGYQYYSQGKLQVVRIRPFSHTGPGHDDRFVIPSFARQLAEMELSLREPVLRVGNLTVERDFTDVRDMVRAYRLALLSGEPGEVYNIGTGHCVRLDRTLERLINLCTVRPVVETDPRLVRPIDAPRQQADPSRFRQRTGWEPRIAWDKTLADTLDFWRQRVAELAPSR